MVHRKNLQIRGIDEGISINDLGPQGCKLINIPDASCLSVMFLSSDLYVDAFVYIYIYSLVLLWMRKWITITWNEKGP